MSKLFSKILKKTLLLSVIIYVFYLLLTPLKLEILPYLGILMCSLMVILVIELIIKDN